MKPATATDAGVLELAASGLLGLTGPADGPPIVFAAPLLDNLAARADGLGVDVVGLLVERAAHAGLHRRGATSPGGAARLLPSDDGVIAVNLPRPSDWELVQAWLEADQPPASWSEVAAAVVREPVARLIGRAELLGLAVAEPGPVADLAAAVTHHGETARESVVGAGLRVLDLSAMWAGPLCARLLAGTGAVVTKLESTGRPDGVRAGDPGFYRRLNAGKQLVEVDLRTVDGRTALRELVAAADVVVDSSRPRAMEQLGVDVTAMVRDHGVTWVSITGYGRSSNRVAFGDDAAVAGGAWVSGPDGTPCFVGDALADPIAGIYAAGAAREALGAGGGLVDVAMASCVADALGGEPPRPVPEAVVRRCGDRWDLDLHGRSGTVAEPGG